MIRKVIKIIAEHSQIALIVSVLIMIIFVPYYWQFSSKYYFNFFFLTLILLSSILTLKKSDFDFKKWRRIGFVIIAVNLVAAITENVDIELVNRLLFVLFFVFVAINLLIGIVKSKEVSNEVIFSAVAVYVLFGFCGAILAAVITFFEPGAFSSSNGSVSQFHQFLYFSYITITSTGYGDILPLTPIARTFAIFLTLFGQLYLTVIIGILIGKYLSNKN